MRAAGFLLVAATPGCASCVPSLLTPPRKDFSQLCRSARGALPAPRRRSGESWPRMGDGTKIDPVFLALQRFNRRQYDECIALCSELLANNPYDQVCVRGLASGRAAEAPSASLKDTTWCIVFF